MSVEYNPKVNGIKSQLPPAREKRKATLLQKAKEKRAEIILMLVDSDYNLTKAYKRIYVNVNKLATAYVEASKLLNNPDTRKEIIEFLSQVDRGLLSIEENLNIDRLKASIIKREIAKATVKKKVFHNKVRVSPEDSFRTAGASRNNYSPKEEA